MPVDKNVMSISDYINDTQRVINDTQVVYKGDDVSLNDGLSVAISTIKKKCSQNTGGRVFFVGNGGSAAIASHMAIDFWKNGGFQAMCFNDASLLTCISNDYSYSQVFEKPIEMFVSSRDILVAISSSGKSDNILNAVSSAKRQGAFTLTLSGFSMDNPLRTQGDLNFYTGSNSYGIVENSHQILLHYIIDTLILTSSSQ